MENKNFKSRGRGRNIVIIIFSIIFITSIVIHKRIIRVYRVVTMFDAGKIVDNFRNMEVYFDSSTVYKGPSSHSFDYSLTELPHTYIYKGETRKTDEFLKDTQTTGLIVIRKDQITFEEYYSGNSEETTTISWSVVKSIISALMGIAVEEGYIADISDPVTKYVPSLIGSGYEGVSIKDVLQMSSGIDFNEDYGDFFSDINRLGRAVAFNTSLDTYVSSLKSREPPGTYNHYISVNTQVLGMVIREATGRSLTSYLEEKIWQQAGMEFDAYWLVDSKGMELAFGGFNAVLRDYARFGMLYLNNGLWDDKQIISKDWIAASITTDELHLEPGENFFSDSAFGYGYHWWIPPDPEGDYLAKGIYSQFIYINPEYKVVIVKSSAYTNFNEDGTERSIETVEVFRTIAESLGN